MNRCLPGPTPRLPTTRRRALKLFAALPLAGLVARAMAEEEGDDPGLEEEPGLEADHPMAPVSARYASLAAYRDTGTLETQYQWPETPLVTRQHRFETAFRAPRHFFFRFDQDPADGADAYVIWCDGGPFQSWWKSVGLHMVHDNGQGAVAFYNAQSPTLDAANLIAPHLFPGAMLYGPTYRLLGAEQTGSEELDGRGTWTIAATGRVTGVQTTEERPTNVWIDDETGLVVRVRVGAEASSPQGMIDSRDFVIAPVADPELPDDIFAFDPAAAT